MKAADIPRRRLHNSQLERTSADAPDQVVRWQLAMQAQDYGPAKWSIGQRSSGLVDGQIDAALREGSVLRTHVLRPTWHFVDPSDIRWLLALTGPRIHQHNARRYRDLGLDDATRSRCEEAIVSALQGGDGLTRDDLGAVLDDRGIDRSGQRLPYILMHCELEAVICSGGLSGRKHTYALLDERAPNTSSLDRDEALVELTRRYLLSHGPATVKDLGWWASLTVADIRAALDGLGAEVESALVEGVRFWWMEADEPAPAPQSVHLLQTYDELIVGYTESRFHGDPRGRQARAAWKDRSLPNGVVIYKGRIAGHWRRARQANGVRVEVALYEDLSEQAAQRLQGEAAVLGHFAGSPVVLTTKTI